MYRIAIVDDEFLFRKGLTMLINQHEKLKVTLSSENGKELLRSLDELSKEELPQLILCDLEMPEMDGVEATKKINALYPNVKIVVLSSHYEAALILKMIEIGASSFVPKNEKPQELYATIINVIERGFHYNDYVIKLIREKMLFGTKSIRTSLVSLTNREEEVLKLICDQKTNKEIAAELFISARTVEGHRNKILEKTHSKNTAGLIIYAIENGVYDVNIKTNKWL